MTQGEEYFMVVNKRNARDPHGDDTPLLEKVALTFSDGIDAIQRLNRRTGTVEDGPMEDHQYTFCLPGGTGELFKYKSDKPFAAVDD